jgi:transcriptional regulator GlxA family with amidase domain
LSQAGRVILSLKIATVPQGQIRPQRSARGGLPAKAKRVHDFLQANVGRKLSVADLARLCEL